MQQWNLPRGAERALTVLALCSAALSASAQAPFGDQQVIDDGATSANAIWAADLDGDGDLDVVAGQHDPGNAVVWYPNLGGGDFGERRPIASSTLRITAVSAADLDLDGDADVLYVAMGDHEVAWHANDGAGNFGPQQLLSAPGEVQGPRSLVASDLDRDGDPDVLVCSRADDEVSWYENLGDGSFASQVVISNAADRVVQVQAADLDGDGDLDVLSASESDHELAWYENDGAGGFGSQIVVSTEVTNAFSLFPADLDSDGDPDILAGGRFGDVAWLRNDGSGGFDPAVPISETALDVFYVWAADLDRDGDTDVLVADQDRNTIVWHENDGAGGFGSEREVTLAVNVPRALFVGDVDADGDPDVLSASFADNKIAWHDNASIHRSALFPVSSPLDESGVGASAIAPSDLDRDGSPDLVTISTAASRVAWHANDTAGGFSPAIPISEQVPGPTALAVGDFDGDGDSDLVVASGGDGSLFGLANDGAGGFGAAQPLVGGAVGITALVEADLDRDGDLDLLAALPGAVGRYDGAGDGSLSKRFSLPGSTGASAVLAADLDRDGDLDAVSTSAETSAFSWAENDGAGGFALPIGVGEPVPGAAALVAGDLDRDGDLDVVVGGAALVWYPNDGSAGFDPVREIASAAPDIAWLGAADLDLDGDLDLVVTAKAPGATPSWYENRGASGFQAHVFPAGGAAARASALTDLDRDGDPDLVSARDDSLSPAWFENRGGQFALDALALPASAALPGAELALFRIDAAHRGRAGDRDALLARLALVFEAAPGVPLETSALEAWVSRVRAYVDDGSGAFDAGLDTLLLETAALSLQDGALELRLDEAPAPPLLAIAEEQRLFVTIELLPKLVTPPSFSASIALRGGARAEDGDDGLPLRLELARDAIETVAVPEPRQWLLALAAAVALVGLRARESRTARALRMESRAR